MLAMNGGSCCARNAGIFADARAIVSTIVSFDRPVLEVMTSNASDAALTALTYMHASDWEKLFAEAGYTGDWDWFIASSA